MFFMFGVQLRLTGSYIMFIFSYWEYEYQLINTEIY